MNKDLHIDQLLDAWLEGNLPETEALHELEKAGISNPLQELHQHSAARMAIIRWSARQDVEAIHREFLTAQQASERLSPPTISAKSRWIRLGLRIAASVLVLLSLAVGIVYWQTSSSKLYKQLNLAYELNTERSADGRLLPKLLQEFQARDFAKVVETFQLLPNPDNRARFLAGYARLQLSAPDKAEQLFQSIIDSNNAERRSLYQDEAEYYLALAHLLQKENTEARALFEKMAKDPQHTYHSQVSKWVRIQLNWLK